MLVYIVTSADNIKKIAIVLRMPPFSQVCSCHKETVKFKSELNCHHLTRFVAVKKKLSKKLLIKIVSYCNCQYLNKFLAVKYESELNCHYLARFLAVKPAVKQMFLLISLFKHFKSMIMFDDNNNQNNIVNLSFIQNCIKA